MFDMDRSSQQFADADLARELSDLTRAANRANTSFYTIDPRGLVGGPDLDEKVDPVEWGNYVRKTQDSLRVIAEETGGYAVVNQNDFDKALKRIDAETSDYYVLGYYSTNPDPTKKNRKVEVKSKRPNVNIWARNTYSLKPAPRVKTKKSRSQAAAPAALAGFSPPRPRRRFAPTRRRPKRFVGRFAAGELACVLRRRWRAAAPHAAGGRSCAAAVASRARRAAPGRALRSRRSAVSRRARRTRRGSRARRRRAPSRR